jgi:hypothetical protein
MPINLPPNCNKENQKISFAFKLSELVRLEHNAKGQGTTKDMKYKIAEVMKLLSDAVKIAWSDNPHSMTTTEHIVDGIVNFPAGVRPKLGVEVDYSNNEGARYSALMGLEADANSQGIDLLSNIDYQTKLEQAKQDCINNNYWNPKLEDIV